MKENEKQENNENNEINQINQINELNVDKTFNKLHKIQILLRKESSLKGLCKYKSLINLLIIKNSLKNNR